MMDGVDDMLEVFHTDDLLLGHNNADYTISFFYLQTVGPDLEHEFQSENIMQKGNVRMYRSTTIWRNLDNTGFCPSQL